jgi:hypothetical protein
VDLAILAKDEAVTTRSRADEIGQRRERGRHQLPVGGETAQQSQISTIKRICQTTVSLFPNDRRDLGQGRQSPSIELVSRRAAATFLCQAAGLKALGLRPVQAHPYWPV